MFHNDVIAVSNEYLLLAHERAYAADGMERIIEAYRALHGKEPTVILIRDNELSVEEAVRTYVFNRQILTQNDGTMAVIAPMEAQTLYDGKAAKLLERIRADSGNPIAEIHTIDLRQSMRNGGGPACLRLRVLVSDAQLKALGQGSNVIAGDALLSSLEKLITKYYSETLTPQELGNPELYHQCKALLGELGKVMRLPLL